MFKPRIGLLAILMGCSIAFPVIGADAPWSNDYDAAKASAGGNGKDILLEFTGADWCGPCIRLKNEVLNQADFLKSASKDFELVSLDFPRSKAQPEAVEKRNLELAQEFGVEGFPTVILLDSNGRAYARTGYQAGGPQKYLEHLDTLRAIKKERDQNFTFAEKSQGLEQAKQLDAILMDLKNRGVFVGYDAVVDKIIKLDSTNASGLKNKYETERRIRDAVMAFTSGDNDGAITKIDNTVKEMTPTGSTRQQLFYIKAIISQKKGDEPGALAALKTAYESAPETPGGKQLKLVIDGWKGKTD